jgi:hypothetical protein
VETWFPPNDDIRIYLLNMRHSWTKNAFWDVNKKKWRKECRFVSPFLFHDTYGLPVFTINIKCPNQVFYVWLVDLQIITAKYGLETWFSPNNDIRKCLLVMKHGTTKNAFWDLNNKNFVHGVSLFHLAYLISLMIYLCSQWTPNFLIKYFMFDWSIFRLLVLNRGWKLDSFQIIFVCVCSTWSIAELKTCSETWITRNDVNGVSLVHLSYLLTLMIYLC